MAQHRHKRETPAGSFSRAALVAAPVAIVATLSAVTMGVLNAEPGTSDQDLLASSVGSTISRTLPSHTALVHRRDLTVSRSQTRSTAGTRARSRRGVGNAQGRNRTGLMDARATLSAVRGADSKLWTTADLNLWNGPGQDAAKVGLVEERKHVLVTGRREADRAEIVIGGTSRWVTAAYLSAEKPAPPETGPSLGGVCANGTAIDAGRPSLYDIFDAVCSNWPEITSYGTWRSDGEHGQGRAMDIMVSGATGWEVANFLRANYGELGIEYLIHARKIWSVERAGEGWRSMADRGSVTANHLDHVHVTVY
ncbi:hypothetical protein EXE58_18810 [Nocardioides seonyuensis]|uniref:ARB-07466-like C-terminal domain-containing protein n=1 Tax=Nocardioides seonyuensis TaxID=2518371 RepID=A0A4P7IIV3_9ACTN|nr:hypothetical protein [Nocardioides seonyuensis]QBX57274.1 hypothetical protein EXE58_18810 [Nocardioides seonyuensis]